MKLHNTLITALGVSAAVTLIGMGVFLLPLKPTLIELQLTFTSQDFAHVYNAWTDVAKARFQAHFTTDYVFIALYAAWGYLHAAYSPSMACFSPKTRRLLGLVLPFAGGVDIVEDVLHQFITADSMLKTEKLVYLAAGSAATIKWLSGLAFLGFAISAKLKSKNTA